MQHAVQTQQAESFPPLHALYMEQMAAQDDATHEPLGMMRQEVLDTLEAMMGVQRSHMLSVRNLHATDQLLEALA